MRIVSDGTALVSCFILCAGVVSTALAQGGGLTPPGPPGATMLSLSEMEPRTPLVNGAPGVTIDPGGTIIIARSGSYYLTGNLSVSSGDGIRISVGGVTLDMRGFTISSTSATSDGNGIKINASHVSIFNGHIVSGTTYDSGAAGDQYTGPGFDNGVYATSSLYTGIRIRNLSVSGCDLNGIHCADGTSSVVSLCTVKIAGGVGIEAATIVNCTAQGCGGIAIRGQMVRGCRGLSTGDDGIRGATVADSYGYSTATGTSADGIDASETAQNCYGHSAAHNGIRAKNVVNSYGYTSGTGTSADGIDASYCVQNSAGRSFGGDGIQAYVVDSSYGYTSGTATMSEGIDATISVQNSYGYSKGGDGIQASVVTGSYGHSIGSEGTADGIDGGDSVHSSYGRSTNGDGIQTTVAGFCRGYSSGSGAADGLQATIAVGCYVTGEQNITSKYLMP